MYNECRHIFTSGKRCQSPALRDQDFCYFHQANRQRSNTSRRSGQPSTLVHHLPPLEDADAIQLAISDVVLALAANRIDPRRAQIIIYGLQVASQNNRQRRVPQVRGAEGAANLGLQDIATMVRETFVHEDGSLVAPPQQQPDPEDIPEKKAPSLGRILLKEAEALKEQKAKQQAQQEAAAEQPADVSRVPDTVNLQAVADIPPAKPCHHRNGRECRVHGIQVTSKRGCTESARYPILRAPFCAERLP
jgi:hypothetical protein